MADLCYLCGRAATRPLLLKDSFTAHSAARVPTSKLMCSLCSWCIPLRCWYYNEGQKKWSKLFSRNWSWLFYGDRLINPVIEGTRTDSIDTLPVVSRLPTRADIRNYLLHPPEPPFTLAIAVSGQKHILPWAREAHDKHSFPIQFELDTIFVDVSSFSQLLQAYESLMQLGFTKTEIDTGDYRSEKLLPVLATWQELESKIAPERGAILLELVSFIGSVAG